MIVVTLLQMSWNWVSCSSRSRNGSTLKITKTDQRNNQPVYIGDNNVNGVQRKFSRQDRQMVQQLARAGNSNLAIADALNGNAKFFSKTYLIGPDGISVTFSDIRRMKSILMSLNAALTEEVLRQLGDEGLSRATQSGRWEMMVSSAQIRDMLSEGGVFELRHTGTLSVGSVVKNSLHTVRLIENEEGAIVGDSTRWGRM